MVGSNNCTDILNIEQILDISFDNGIDSIKLSLNADPSALILNPSLSDEHGILIQIMLLSTILGKLNIIVSFLFC